MGFAAVKQQFSQLFGPSIKFPSVHEARWITDQMKYSPDYGWLEQFEYQLLFAADDTKENHDRHCLIEDSRLMAEGFTVDYFNYWLQEAGDERVPVPMRLPAGKHLRLPLFPPPLKIRGELFLVRTPQFLGLDTYKRNTVQFRRQRVNIIIPHRQVWKIDNVIDPTDHPVAFRPRELPRCLQGNQHIIYSGVRCHIIRAWMYVGLGKFWDPLFDGGFRGFKTVNYYESKNKSNTWAKEYYDYPKRPLE